MNIQWLIIFVYIFRYNSLKIKYLNLSLLHKRLNNKFITRQEIVIRKMHRRSPRTEGPSQP